MSSELSTAQLVERRFTGFSTHSKIIHEVTPQLDPTFCAFVKGIKETVYKVFVLGHHIGELANHFVRPDTTVVAVELEENPSKPFKRDVHRVHSTYETFSYTEEGVDLLVAKDLGYCDPKKVFEVWYTIFTSLKPGGLLVCQLPIGESQIPQSRWTLSYPEAYELFFQGKYQILSLSNNPDNQIHPYNFVLKKVSNKPKVIE